MTNRRAGRSAASDRLPTESIGGRRGDTFRQEGEYWTIVYEGTLFRLRDGKGLRYLAQLLSHPDERFHCADLWSGVTRRKGEAVTNDERTRVAVTKRIKASLVKITALHPRLALHLKTRIKTGTFCVYVCDPRGPVSWKF
jgi:hypothetical protein